MSHPEHSYEFAGRRLESPLINAAGSINGTNTGEMMQRIDELLRTGIGGLTLGSFTIPAQEGNQPKYGDPVFIIDEVQGKTWNAMGLPNIGSDAAVELSDGVADRVHSAGKILVYSGSPTNAPEHGTSVDQAVSLSKAFLETKADLVEINVSCPNVVTEEGGRKPIMGYDLQTMYELVDALESEVGFGQRLGIKLPPYLTEEQLDIIPDLANLFRTTRVFRFLVTCNTIPNQVPEDQHGKVIPLSVPPTGAGGMSGPYISGRSRDQLAYWHDQTNGEVDIMSAGGIDTGRELAVRRRIGAKVGSGVTFLWRSNNWPAAVTRVLEEFSEEPELA